MKEDNHQIGVGWKSDDGEKIRLRMTIEGKPVFAVIYRTKFEKTKETQADYVVYQYTPPPKVDKNIDF